MNSPKVLPLLTLIVLGVSVAVAEEPVRVASALWGNAGELWSEQGRLPDFSYAGYRSGEAAIPTLPVSAKVTDFGAIPDDDGDDTAAFVAALEKCKRGAVLIPKGRYILTNRVSIQRPGVVLRGEDREGCVLFFPKGLEQIDPRPVPGRNMSGYSWSDGFLGVRGSVKSDVLANVGAPAARGSRRVTVGDAGKLAPGMEVLVEVQDDGQKSLYEYLYGGDPGNMSKIEAGKARVGQVVRIVAIEGNTVTVDRPLRVECRPEWKPLLRQFEPSVRESGIESLTIAFPERMYGGHFTEQGYNALVYTGVRDCWAREITVVNADSGVHSNARFCTFAGLTFRMTPGAVPNKGDFGHHGFSISGADNLITQFDFQHRFIHDLTSTTLGAGNVFSNGRGVDLCFDHHKKAPHANLFTNIDIGAGTRPWRSGGGADIGRNCGAWTTFWGIRSAQSFKRQPGWSPELVNFIGVPLTDAAASGDSGFWNEPIAAAELTPANLHEAQLALRLAKKQETPATGAP